MRNDKQLRRTAAHESGHLSGLAHPVGDEDPDNLMWQSKKSMGTHIIQQQIDKIKNEK